MKTLERVAWGFIILAVIIFFTAICVGSYLIARDGLDSKPAIWWQYLIFSSVPCMAAGGILLLVYIVIDSTRDKSC